MVKTVTTFTQNYTTRGHVDPTLSIPLETFNSNERGEVKSWDGPVALYDSLEHPPFNLIVVATHPSYASPLGSVSVRIEAGS